jgi:hypothetical protein
MAAISLSNCGLPGSEAISPHRADVQGGFAIENALAGEFAGDGSVGEAVLGVTGRDKDILNFG